MTAVHCSAAAWGSCSNNSHLLQRFVNLDVRHQLELQEYHHRVKMETERETDYLLRSGDRPWAVLSPHHVHMWPLVCSLLIIMLQLVGFMSGYKWCVVSYDECNVRQGLAGAWFQLFVSGRLSGYQGQNSPEQAPLPHHWADRWEDRVCVWLNCRYFLKIRY